jgi:hypothetical protein
VTAPDGGPARRESERDGAHKQAGIQGFGRARPMTAASGNDWMTPEEAEADLRSLFLFSRDLRFPETSVV